MNSMSLKISSEFLVKPLTNLCNLSLTQVIFPSQLKMSFPCIKVMIPCCLIITDLFLYCVFFQRFLKKNMYNRVSTFLEKFKILHENQYCFRNKLSTHLALLSFVDKVIQAIEKGEYAVGAFLDFSKAFDTVDHDILLDKLDHYGIRGCALSWFKSYLSCRTQYITYGGSESNRQMIKCGVPHGSILGPLLFLIYTNDLCTVCKLPYQNYLLMTPTCFLVVLDATGIQDGVNHDLAIITEWLKANKLSSNINKRPVGLYIFALTLAV